MKNIKVKRTQKDAEARQCVRFPMRRPLHEAGNIKPKLQWRLQSVGYARIMGHLLREAEAQSRAGSRKWSHVRQTTELER